MTYLSRFTPIAIAIFFAGTLNAQTGTTEGAITSGDVTPGVVTPTGPAHLYVNGVAIN